MWRPAFRGKKPLWLDEAAFHALRRGRKTELERSRVVVWPSQVSDEVVRSFVEAEGLPNRRAHDLVGFPSGSGPNCFGAVMGAAGVAGAEDEWMQLAPFTAWLEAHCRRGGSDGEPGTVLLWRDAATGDPFHAALTLGDGWAFEKPSQCWWTPRYVTTVGDIKRDTRMRGIRLERWRIAR